MLCLSCTDVPSALLQQQLGSEGNRQGALVGLGRSLRGEVLAAALVMGVSRNASRF